MNLREDLQKFEADFAKTLEGAKQGNPYAGYMGKAEQSILIRLRAAIGLLEKTVGALDGLHRYNQADLNYHNSPAAIEAHEVLKQANDLGFNTP